MNDDLVSLRQAVRQVPDWPQEGITFLDISPVLNAPELFQEAVRHHFHRVRSFHPVEGIVSIDSRGFLFGSPLAYLRQVPLVLARKTNKLPPAVLSVEFALEYGTAGLDIVQGLIIPGNRYLIVDDVLATGGTAAAAAELVEMADAEVAGFLFFIEIEALNGKEKLESFQSYHSILKF